MTEEDNQDLYLEIDDVSYSRILELSKQGDDYGKRKEFSKAIDSYYEALNLVPDPKEDYSATTWLLTAIGESYLFLKDYENARNVLRRVMHCPNAIGNGFIHLILGIAQFELEDFERAKQNLATAYIVEGKEIFEGDEMKYYEYLKLFMRDLE